jgi:hypothetical protein
MRRCAGVAEGLGEALGFASHQYRFRAGVGDGLGLGVGVRRRQ